MEALKASVAAAKKEADEPAPSRKPAPLRSRRPPQEEASREETGREEAGGAEEGRRGVVRPERSRPSQRRSSDLAAVVELLRAHELADHSRVTADWNEIVRFVWRDPGVPTSRMTGGSSSAVAFRSLRGRVPRGRRRRRAVHLMARVPAAGRDGGALLFLVDRVVARARERGARSAVSPGLPQRRRAPGGYARARLPAGAVVVDDASRDRSGRADRGSPDGIRFTTLAEHPDERSLYRADQEAFADHFGFAPEAFDVWRERRFDADDDDRSR